jgi:hypothetical protein
LFRGLILGRPLLGRPLLWRPLLGRPLLGRSLLGRSLLRRALLRRPLCRRWLLRGLILGRPLLRRALLRRLVLRGRLLRRRPRLRRSSDRRLDVGPLVQRPGPLLVLRRFLFADQLLRSDVEDPNAGDDARPACVHHAYMHDPAVLPGAVDDPAARWCDGSDALAGTRPGRRLLAGRSARDPDAALSRVGEVAGWDAESPGVVTRSVLGWTLVLSRGRAALLPRPVVAALLVLRLLFADQLLRSDVEDADADDEPRAPFVYHANVHHSPVVAGAIDDPAARGCDGQDARAGA